MAPALPSEIERQSLRECFRRQLRSMIASGGEPGHVLLVWVFSGDLPNSDLADIYKAEVPP